MGVDLRLPKSQVVMYTIGCRCTLFIHLVVEKNSLKIHVCVVSCVLPAGVVVVVVVVVVGAELFTCPYPLRFRHTHHKTKDWLPSLGEVLAGGLPL